MEAIFTLIVFSFFFLIIFGVYALIYVGQALGTYRMMRATGLPHAWTAWVPLCNLYALGAVADHQAIRNEGRDKHYRRKLLIWTIAFILFCVGFFAYFIAIFSAGIPEDISTSSSMAPSEPAGMRMEFSLLFLLMIPLYALEIVFMVYYYIVLYKIYKLFSPTGAVGLTVLSIFVSVAVPIVLFVLSRNHPVYENPIMDGYGSNGEYDFIAYTNESDKPSNGGWDHDFQ